MEITFYPHKKAKHLDPGKGLEWMRAYVQKRLLASGVIPVDEANPVNPYSLAAHIVHEALRQPTVDFLDGRGMYAIHYADELIERAISHPPEPISEKRFSLKAFVKEGVDRHG